MKHVAVIGSTGSIGRQTIEIIRDEQLSVVALAVDTGIDELEKQIREFSPKIACVYNKEKAEILKTRVSDCSTKIVSGMDGLFECVTESTVDIVLMSVVGMIGIQPTIEAIKAGKDIALANKETLVTAGHIIMPLVKEYGVKLLPVDSEHSAIFQSLRGEPGAKIEKILLTASGGPFRGKKREELMQVTAEDALKHPNWFMGKKITIDSSTLVNKGLEVMEAKWLFDVKPGQIEVLIQPQSILHSAVQFNDGGIIGQMGVQSENVVMNLGSAAAGYGYEYVASTIDRVKAAALTQNDAQLQMPIVTPVADEAWSVKESIVSEADFPEWGPVEERAINMEVATAAACLAGGSNAVILKHPTSVGTISKLVAELV